MKKVLILGSTGSLGTQCIGILKKYTKEFRIAGLCAHKNKKLLNQQGKELKISKSNLILVEDGKAKVLDEIIKRKNIDIVVNVISGAAGINHSKAAVKAGKMLVLGNKESLVAEGEFLKKYIKNIFPVDSEHNAIYEILKRFLRSKVLKITLPCSGGPFLNKSKKQLERVTPKEATNHPRWKMGKKVSVESATLINKGLEIVEAHYLFGLPLDKIKVMIHPECLVHGVVEFENKGEYAYISPPDMREHLENALLRAIGKSSPKRRIDKFDPSKYSWKKPGKNSLPGIETVLKHFKKSPERMKEFLEKEEKAINEFLDGKIKFTEIYKLLK